jgi:uncharacterized damage-inducible protein DinB
MVTIDEILQELEQEAQATRRALERLPEDRLGWKPHPKSMSLGQLAMHIAGLPGAIAAASRTSLDVKTAIPLPQPTRRAEVLARFDESMDQARAILRDMDDAELTSPWKMMNGEQELWSIPRGAFLRSVMLNHWYHHRGQLTVYLRQTGAAVPAIYGSSADEKAIPL